MAGQAGLSDSEQPTFLSAATRRETDGARGPQPIPGAAFGPYLIARLLGSGGMGDVYEAEHSEHGRRVALKVLGQRLATSEDRARFLREGEIAASITHPNTVYVYGSEEIAGSPVIVMELLSGGTFEGSRPATWPTPAEGCRRFDSPGHRRS
jgi:serine/threonine protein kinase